jgi:hypothetical protein
MVSQILGSRFTSKRFLYETGSSTCLGADAFTGSSSPLEERAAARRGGSLSQPRLISDVYFFYFKFS